MTFALLPYTTIPDDFKLEYVFLIGLQKYILVFDKPSSSADITGGGVGCTTCLVVSEELVK